MTGATYAYLAATSVFMLWAIALAILLTRALRTVRVLKDKNRELMRSNKDLKYEVEYLSVAGRAQRKKSATNTDYLIEEEEYA
jgi:hypothetical protein